jgi:hypothetical protein
MVTLRAEQVMLTPRFKANLSQRRRTQSLAGKYLLEAQRDFSRTLKGFSIELFYTKVLPRVM